MPLINCEIDLDLSWSKYCVIFEILRADAVAANRPNAAREVIETSGATFQINSDKLYITAATLSINDNIKFLQNIKQGFRRTASWKK